MKEDVNHEITNKKGVPPVSEDEGRALFMTQREGQLCSVNLRGKRLK